MMGSKQVAIVGALSVLSKGNSIIAAVSYSDDFNNLLDYLSIPRYNKVSEKGFIDKLKESDLLLSVQALEIVDLDLLKMPLYGGINVHAYLYKYKGAHPVTRALEDKNYKASVGVHVMTEKVDEGKILVEKFVDISTVNSAEEAYNRLYPHYPTTILEALSMVSKRQE
tara:strand:- start:242 stop:745 length:504 start_codon:yes stop_codon:yes gene_type:complete